MKVYIFKKSSDEANETLDLLLDQLQDRNIEYKIIDAEQKENIGQLESYDITSTPSVLVCQDDGTTVELWQNSLPTSDQVAYALGHV